jgi:hypothetical protein
VLVIAQTDCIRISVRTTEHGSYACSQLRRTVCDSKHPGDTFPSNLIDCR